MNDRDHAACVLAYCDGVLSGEIVAGRYVRLAVQRHQHDLEHAGERGLYFDETIAQRACKTVERLCTHVKAEWAGRSFRLSPNQQFILWSLMGWRREEDDLRRFRKAYLTCGRKWGKSLFASAILKLLTLCDEPIEPGAECYTIATAEDQARLVYDAFEQMIKQSPSKKIRHAAQCRTKRVSFPDPPYFNSFVRPLGSDSKNKDGLNPHLVIVDELHEWRAYYRKLWEKMSTGGGSRRQPLTVIITTAGDDKSTIWLEQDDLATRMLDGVEVEEHLNDSLFAFVARIDEDDDPFDEACWPKANPNMVESFAGEVPEWAEGLGTPKIAYLREAACNARLNPADENALRRYHANIRVASTERAIRPLVWAAGDGDLREWPDVAYGGFDLGRSDDWAARAIIARVDGDTIDNAVWQLHVETWAAEDGSIDLRQHPYRQWVSEGLINICTGDAIDYDTIEQQIAADSVGYNIEQWRYDNTFAEQLAQNLLNTHGCNVSPMHQSSKSYNEPLRSFLRAVKQGRILHGGDPVLAWQACNLIIKRDAKDQWMPDKPGSLFKIDGIVAALMAYEAALFFESQGVAGVL
jgi:phage terminase large subunit-like protein